MYYIQSLPLIGYSLQEMSHIIYLESDGCYLHPDFDQGSFLMPAFKPRLAESWEGFEVFPGEVGVEIQVRHPDTHQAYQHVVDQGWQPTAPSTYQSVAAVRRGLTSWRAGGIQLSLRLTRQANGSSPLVGEVSLGFDVAQEQLGYILDFSLPQALSQSVQIIRVVEPLPDGRSVAIPVGIDAGRMQNPRVRIPPENQILHGEILPADPNLPARLQVTFPMPSRAAYLLFDYVLRVEHAPAMYELSEVPAVIVRCLPPQNERKIIFPRWLQISDFQVYAAVESRLVDVAIDVIVVARDYQESRTIANQLVANVNSRNFLEVPGWGSVLPMMIQQGLQAGAGTIGEALVSGDMMAHYFRVLLLNIQQGQAFERRAA